MITITTQNGDILANISGKSSTDVQKLSERIRKAYAKASHFIPNNPNISVDNYKPKCGQRLTWAKDGAIYIHA